jgi:hypothetical protein
MLATQAPYSQYFDKNGDPLDAGFVYFGQPNQNPETAPLTVYWDYAGTQPVAQPARTLAGYIVRNGTPARVYAEGAYSVTVRNRKGEMVYYAPTSTDFSDLPVNRAVVTATNGQTLVNLPFAYTRGNNSLQLFVNGLIVRGNGVDYTETTTTSVTFSSGLSAGDEVEALGGALLNPANALGMVSDVALAAPTGSALVGHIASGTGAVARTVQSKLRDIVSAEDYTGYDKTGATDCKAAILAAAVAIGVGGIVYTPGKALIDTALTVPAGVTLKGPFDQVASFGSNQDASTYNSMAALIVNSAVSIKLSSGACIDGCFIYRKGMTFPAANTSAFAGTAIIGDGTSFLDGDDLNIKNCLIAGFSQAIYTNQCQRVKCTDIYFDCLSGIHIENSVDVSYVTRCHGWPFSTIKTYALAGGINGGNAAEVLLQRSGTAFKFSNVGDWTKVTDCFSYAYYRGVHVLNCNSMTLFSVSTDNTPEDATSYALPLAGYPGAVGIWVDGTSFDTRLIACQSAAQGTAGYRFSTSANIPSRMIGCDAWSPIERCVLVDGGDVSITGGTLRNAPDAIVITSAASRVWVDKVRFNAISGFPYKVTVSTSLLEIGADNDYGNFAAGSALVNGTLTTPALASAATLNLPATGDEFNITGTTNFGTMVGGHKDRRVTLFFAGILTVFTGTGTTNNMRMSGATNFTTAAGSTLTLAHNGTQWYEVSRSA